jgi:hypothetical protein
MIPGYFSQLKNIFTTENTETTEKNSDLLFQIKTDQSVLVFNDLVNFTDKQNTNLFSVSSVFSVVNCFFQVGTNG